MITVVGEALLDLIAEPGSQIFASRPGGSPANVAVGLARLGGQVLLATQLADDLPGRIVGKHLRANDVAVQRLPAQTSSTSIALAVLDSDGGATYDFRIAWDVTEPPRISPDCQCLHTGSIATALYPGAAVVEDLMRNLRGSGAVTVSLDPNIRPSLLGSIDGERVRVERQVCLADIVKVSAEDLRWLYPGADPRTVAWDWLATGPALVVVTLGADGAYARTTQFAATRSSPRVAVVDTVGAGDAFTAGLLDALGKIGLLGGSRREQLAAINGSELDDVLDFAIAFASATCGRQGADPPHWRKAETRSL
ncbi:carbohydrate kinase family protein [Nocardia sp. KC 131]|uniref:carbohydrate kinase family protein n=1 Tax=Nocardia arseniciresistens TaxID=3392119 RepID=UPI00398E63BA